MQVVFGKENKISEVTSLLAIRICSKFMSQFLKKNEFHIVFVGINFEREMTLF